VSSPITRIEIAGFRGATKPLGISFNPKKIFTLLYGENGSGKSTILDAIDVVWNSNVGSLENVSVGSRKAKYLPSLGVAPGALQIAIRSDAELWTASIDKNEVVVVGPERSSAVRVLRRKKILALVEAQPKQRYDELSKFIETTVVEKSEVALHDARKAADGRREELERTRSEKREQLDELCESEGGIRPPLTSLDWAKQETGKGISELGKMLSCLKDVVELQTSVIEKIEAYLRELLNCSTHAKEFERVTTRIQALPNVDTLAASKLIASLETAKDYVASKKDLKECPTCLRGIRRDELAATIDSQLAALGPLTALVREGEEIKKRKIASQNMADRTLEMLTDAAASCERAMQELKTPGIDMTVIRWPKLPTDTIKPEALTHLLQELKDAKTQLSTKAEATQRTVSQFHSIDRLHAGYIQADRELGGLDRVRDWLGKTYDRVHELRVSFVQRVLDDIVEDVNRLYGAIHPGEEIGLSKLIVHEKKRGSVEQTGVFHGHDSIKPQVVLSESHLDTLGFCVWLALAQRDDPHDSILIIDDVFTSVDNQHNRRILDLLLRECDKFLQVIITSHLRRWWSRCQDAHGVERLELGTWSVGNGIYLQAAPLQSDRLLTQSKEGVLDRQSVASKAGVLLERALTELVLAYGLRIRRTWHGDNTLGELIRACQGLFGKNNLTTAINRNWRSDGQEKDFVTTDLKSCFDQIVELEFIRNEEGCHFRTETMDASDAEVRLFGSATANLVQRLFCPNCGQIATKANKTGTGLRCSCKKQAVQMTPVKVP
jgi:ABC-type Mn2+/Zn2+ transport system ATPase subunit